MTFTARHITVALTILVSAIGCTESAPPSPSAPAAPRLAPDAWLGALLGGSASTTSYPILVGAGDIARCYPDDNPLQAVPASQTPAEATARLLDRIPGTVIAVGDNAYQYGSPTDYATCYDPTWGRHKARTRPATGNHEYLTPGAAGYFAYFGAAAHPETNGYYSYDVSGWHVVVLNSTPQWALCPPEPPLHSADDGRRCVGDATQRLWLAADLASHPARCTVAYFHHPRFSSGEHGNQYEMQQFWDIMYANGVDLVIGGHDHDYERFAPQTPDAVPDPVTGIREIVAGTGGAELRGFATVVANSEVRIPGVYGVLALALGDGEYGWAFLTTSGRIADAGRGACH